MMKGKKTKSDLAARAARALAAVEKLGNTIGLLEDRQRSLAAKLVNAMEAADAGAVDKADAGPCSTIAAATIAADAHKDRVMQAQLAEAVAALRLLRAKHALLAPELSPIFQAIDKLAGKQT